MVGPPGKDGVIGAMGFPGPAGLQGPRGQEGATGPQVLISECFYRVMVLYKFKSMLALIS